MGLDELRELIVWKVFDFDRLTNKVRVEFVPGDIYVEVTISHANLDTFSHVVDVGNDSCCSGHVSYPNGFFRKSTP